MSAREEGDKAERRARSAHARGMRLAGRGWSREAARCFGDAVELCPDRVESWDALAAALAESEDAAGALHAQLEAVRRAPERLDLRLNLGTLLHAMGPPLAVSCLEEAAADESLAADAHLTLGILHGDLGRHHQARHHLEQSLAREPNDPEALQELAALQLEASEVKEAIGTLRRVLKLEPESPELWMDLARAYAAQRLASPAREALDRAETHGARGPDLALIEALILMVEGELDKALAALTVACTVPEGDDAEGPGPLPLEFLDDPAFEPLRERQAFTDLYLR